MSTYPPLACQNTLFDWAESLDTKSWSQLESLFTPELKVDYGGIGGFENVNTPAAFVATCQGPLGHPDISTQHFIGACRWEELSDKKRWSVNFQIRVAHWRTYESGKLQIVKGHGLNTMEFELVEGVWKIAFLKVRGRKMEGDIVALIQGKE